MKCAAASATHASLCEQLAALTAGAERAWRLEVGPSTLAGGGNGVHLRGVAAAGTVLAVYPGVVFAAEDLPAMHKMILPGNEYVMARRDGVLIDGRPDGPSRALWMSAQARELAAGSAPLIEGAELSCGNMVNHPPAGTPASVCVQPLDLLAADWPELHPHIATLQFRPPAPGAPVKQTVVLLARRELADEELWLDYKLRPQGPLEPWYAPAAAAAADG